MVDPVNQFATLVWPPTGIALAALYILGLRFWPAIALSAFFVNFTAGAPLFASLAIGMGNALEALMGSYLLRRRLDFHPSLGRLKDVIYLTVFAAILSTMVSATIGVTGLWLTGTVPAVAYAMTWRAWWVGDALGNLIVAPLLLVWSAKPALKIKPLKFAEAVLLFSGTIFMSLGVFNGFFRDLGVAYAPLPYSLFPFVIWAALRFGQPGSVTLAILISVLAVWGTFKGQGPFILGPLSVNLIFLHSFLAVIVITGMTLAAALAERNSRIHALRAAKRRLKAQYGDRLAVEEKLRRAIEARDEFLSIASHELKTPITSLKLQLEITRRGLDPRKEVSPPEAKLLRCFDISMEQVRRISSLVEDLLDVSKMGAGKLPLNLEEFDLKEVIGGVADRLRDQLEEANCRLSLSFETDAALIVRGDRFRLEQVMINLLINAMKYAAGKPIQVSGSLSEDSGKIIVIVRDYGMGISKEMLSRVFNRFERALSQSRIGGLGLGLYISKQIVEAHGGLIRAESELGQGSSFIVELPRMTLDLSRADAITETASEGGSCQARKSGQLPLL